MHQMVQRGGDAVAIAVKNISSGDAIFVLEFRNRVVVYKKIMHDS